MQRTFQITIAALQDSQLSVEDLDIFGSLKGCSLACYVFRAFAQQSISWLVFGSVKRLTTSLSVSSTVATDPESRACAEGRRPTRKADIRSVSSGTSCGCYTSCPNWKALPFTGTISERKPRLLHPSNPILGSKTASVRPPYHV